MQKQWELIKMPFMFYRKFAWVSEWGKLTRVAMCDTTERSHSYLTTYQQLKVCEKYLTTEYVWQPSCSWSRPPPRLTLPFKYGNWLLKVMTLWYLFCKGWFSLAHKHNISISKWEHPQHERKHKQKHKKNEPTHSSYAVLTCLCLCHAYACAYVYALVRTSLYTEHDPLSSPSVVLRKSKIREVRSIMSAISTNSYSTILNHCNPK